MTNNIDTTESDYFRSILSDLKFDRLLVEFDRKVVTGMEQGHSTPRFWVVSLGSEQDKHQIADLRDMTLGFRKLFNSSPADGLQSLGAIAYRGGIKPIAIFMAAIVRQADFDDPKTAQKAYQRYEQLNVKEMEREVAGWQKKLMLVGRSVDGRKNMILRPLSLKPKTCVIEDKEYTEKCNSDNSNDGFDLLLHFFCGYMEQTQQHECN